MPDHTILTPYFLDQPLPALDDLALPGWTVNQPPLPAAASQHRMSLLYENIAASVATALAHGRRPVSLAGDCCAALGMVAGLQRAGLRPSLLWFDAHGDFNTWETSPSGFLGGMPLAMLAGRGEMTMPHALGLHPFPEDQVYLSDGRDLDPLERQALLASAVHLQPLEDFVPPPGPLYVHFDVDIVRTADLPAVSYPAPGGPSAADLARLFTALAATGRVAAVSFSAWNPALDQSGISRNTALKLLQYLLA